MGDADDIQKQIIGEISLRGNIAAETLAKRLKVRPHIVRYHLHRLLKSGSLRRTVLIDQRNLGYQSSMIIFNLAPQHQSAAVRFLQSRRCASWLAHNNGIREFEMSLVTNNPADVLELTTELANRTGATFAIHLLPTRRTFMTGDYGCFRHNLLSSNLLSSSDRDISKRMI